MMNYNFEPIIRWFIKQIRWFIKQLSLLPPHAQRRIIWRVVRRVSRTIFQVAVSLVRDPASFWDWVEYVTRITLKRLGSDDYVKIMQPLISKVVQEYYEWITFSFTRAIISCDDPRLVYIKTLRMINKLLSGEYKPLFAPVEISTPNPAWIELLEKDNVVRSVEAIEGVSFDHILSLLNADTALLYTVVGDAGTHVIVVHAAGASPEVLFFETFTRARVENVLSGWLWLYHWHSELYDQKLIDEVINKNRLKSGEMFRIFIHTNVYNRLFYNQYLYDHLCPTEVPSVKSIPTIPSITWLLMEAILRELGKGDLTSGSHPKEGLWQRIDEKLQSQGIRRIILCLDKMFALFPHHAAILSTTNDGQKQCLMDKYEVIYLPQGAFGRSTPAEQETPRLLIFGTDGEAMSNLRMESVNLLSPGQITRWHASGERLSEQFASELSRLSDVNALTFLGHGKYDWLDSSQSYLGILSDSEGGLNGLLTLKFLHENIPSHVNTIVLAACETGLPKVTADISRYKGFAEDLIDLPHVSTVVSTLWPVHQISTVLLMRQFHQYWLLGDPETGEEPLSPAGALHRAQLWLRKLTREQAIAVLNILDSLLPTEEVKRELEVLQNCSVERPYAHPYFWASFYVMGGYR